MLSFKRMRTIVLGLHLAALVAAIWGLAGPAASQSPPDVIELPGIVRDFQRSHPDFDVPGSVGEGHVAGNVAFTLEDGTTPTLAGAGFRVVDEWRDMSGNPIAPHLYSWDLARQVSLVTEPTITNNPTLDSYDSDAGAYGGNNVGGAPIFRSGQEMPAVEEPADMPPYQAQLSYVGSGSSTLDRDVHCGSFVMRNQHTLRIRGKVTIVCDDSFTIDQRCSVVVPDGSQLTLYIKGSFELSNYVKFNYESGDPYRATIYNLGTSAMTIGNNVHIYAQIIAPEAPLYIANNGDFYGTYEGLSVVVDNFGGFHLAAPPLRDQCARVLDDQEGTRGGDDNAGVTSATTFRQWYRDSMGTNLSMTHVIRLVRNLDGVYEYSEPNFYPIDDRLFGNEGEAHNNNFTYEAVFEFIYAACLDQFFELGGADDIYLFLDNGMVIDLGGIGHDQLQRIDLDRLELTDGERYRGALFYAHRHSGGASFTMRTNVDLIVPSIPFVASAAFD